MLAFEILEPLSIKSGASETRFGKVHALSAEDRKPSVS